MSAGVFTLGRYQASYDGTRIHPIRTQPETLAAAIGALTNGSAVPAVNVPISAVSTPSRRKYGLFARFIRMRIAGTVPTGYAPGSIVVIPAITTAFYAAAIRGATVNYLGTTWTIISRGEERAA